MVEDGAKQLPDGWEWMTIGDVANTTSGGTPSRKYPEYFQGTIPWVKSGELGDGLFSFVEENITETAIKNSSAKIFPAGTVLVALYGATVGKVGILNIDAATNQAVCGLFPKNNSFTAKYMFYWLMSQRQDLINKSMGGAQPNISQGIVRSHPFPLAPLPEQERVVSRIEELFSDLEAGVLSLERVRAGLRRYKASVLKAACEGKLLNGKSGIGEGELPDGWRWIKFGEISNLITKGSSPNWQGFEYQNSGITFVRSQNIGWGNLELDSLVYLPQEFNLKEKKSVIHKDDVLFNIVGASIGRCAKATSAIEGGNLNQAVAIIRLKQDLALPDYAVNYLLTPNAQHKINLEKVDVARANISLADIREMSIPLPPLDEQRRIVAEVERRLSVVGEVEAAVEAGLVRAGRLRQSVLRSAFEGRL